MPEHRRRLRCAWVATKPERRHEDDTTETTPRRRHHETTPRRETTETTPRRRDSTMLLTRSRAPLVVRSPSCVRSLHFLSCVRSLQCGSVGDFADNLVRSPLFTSRQRRTPIFSCLTSTITAIQCRARKVAWTTSLGA